MTCERCGREAQTYTYSWYNEQAICLLCRDYEKKRSDYLACRKAELEAVKRGDLNYNYKTEMNNGT